MTLEELLVSVENGGTPSATLYFGTVCLKAWQLSGVVENYQTLQLKYEGCWRKMWLLRHTDGLYVSRNTYIRAGVAEWTVSNPVHLDLLSLVTSGVNDREASGFEEDILGLVEGWQDDETHNPDVPPISHKRDMKPFVFVPFEEAEKSVLNPPVEKMDYFVAG